MFFKATTIMQGQFFLIWGICIAICQALNKENLRLLILSVDNRPLASDFGNTNYHTLAAVINNHYAKLHHYDFAFVTGKLMTEHSELQENSDPVNYIITKYNTSLPALENSDAKHGIDSFNVKLKQFRAASWTKVLVVWSLLEQHPNISQKYDYILFMDSDAVISPTMGSRSLDQFFEENELPDRIAFGPPPREASILVISI